ncbi:MAG: hypothetical protein JJT99_00755 [Rhodobacteraceae bacterium]|nr:hypothetical protein [Paracoccaceae bacterium]
MTSISTNTIPAMDQDDSSFLDRVILPLLQRMAQLSPSYRRLEYYNAKSDAELAELGLTRADIPAMVLGARFHAC